METFVSFIWLEGWFMGILAVEWWGVFFCVKVESEV
jgi:hypothetical protein